jgi:hypothetical protein
MFNDEGSSPDGEQQSEQSGSNFGAGGNVGDQQHIPASEIPDPKQEHPHTSESPFFIVRWWRSFRYWQTNPFRVKRTQSTVAEMATIFLTCVIAVIGFLQYSVYRQQKRIMEDSSGQTTQLIEAANIQACAAKSFADSAAYINAGIGTAVGNLNLQAQKLEENANQTSRLAKAAEVANANVVNSNRPWVGIDESAIQVAAAPNFVWSPRPNDPPTLSLDLTLPIKNFGTAPALHENAAVWFFPMNLGEGVSTQKPPSSDLLDGLCFMSKDERGDTLLPGAVSHNTHSATPYGSIKGTHLSLLWIAICITYEDAAQKPHHSLYVYMSAHKRGPSVPTPAAPDHPDWTYVPIVGLSVWNTEAD